MPVAERSAGAREEREAILQLIEEFARWCRQMPPRQEDEGVARLRALADLRQEIERRGEPTVTA